MINKDAYGLIAVGLAFVSNGAYFVSVLRKKTKPHVFSWTIWGLLTGVTFFAQRSAHAGPGAWHMAINCLICFMVAALALLHGGHNIRRGDILTFLGALMAIPVWYITQEPLTAVIIVVCVEAFAYYPTFRKSYASPHDELAFTYSVDAARCGVSILAIESYSFTTLLYPIFIIAMNVALVGMLLKRRQTKAI